MIRRSVALALALAASLAPTLTPTAAATATGASRQSRASHVAVGGGDIYLSGRHHGRASGAGCSLAFAVLDASDNPAALTAGHCVATLSGTSPYRVYQSRRSGHTVYLGDRLGAVRAGQYHAGRHGDNALISLAAGRRAEPDVFIGGRRSTRTAPITSAVQPARGMSGLCYSGATTGEHCGFRIVQGPHTIPFDDRGHHYVIRHEWAMVGPCTARAGDSGAPVYRPGPNGDGAVGIVSAGGSVGNRCAVYFTPVALAMRHLHASLMTASTTR